MKAVFITGTDTGVGKTVVAGLLARFLSGKGYRVITQKWAQTGDKKNSNDIIAHLRLMGKKPKDIKQYMLFVLPYSFRRACSPHLAASLEKKTVSSAKIKESFKFLSQKFDFVIVEGTGGALTPLNKSRLVIDIAKELKLPALIVAANKLGAVSHTLLTIEAVRKRKMKIAGVVFNNQPGKTDGVILKDNPKIIQHLSGVKVLGTLPRVKNKEALYKKADFLFRGF